MRDIMVSIYPGYVDNIINGVKKYEYRKIAPKQTFCKMIIYKKGSGNEVVAEAEVIDILKNSPSNIWQSTGNNSGMTKQEFDDYFNGKKEAYAFKLGKITVYSPSKKLSAFGIKSAQQIENFKYI